MIKKPSKIHFIWFVIPLVFFSGLGIDIVTPSLPIITAALGALQTQGQLIVVTYILGFGIGQVFIGPLSDHFGRKITITSSLILFIACCFAIIFSSSIYILLVFRLVQGIAMAGLVLNVRAVVADSFSGKAMCHVSIYMTTTWALSPVLGPFFGAWLQTLFGWKSEFYSLAFCMFVMLVLNIIFLPETNIHRGKPFRVGHIVRNYRVVSSSLGYMRYVMGILLAFALINIFNIAGPFIIQVELNHSPLYFGHIALLLGFLLFLGSFGNRFFTKHFTVEQMILTSIVSLIVASAAGLIVSIYTGLNIVIIVIPVLLMTFFLGVLYPNYSASCTAMFKSIAGTASAVRGVISMVGSGLILAGISFIKIHSVHVFLATYLVLAILSLFVFLMKISNPVSTG